jgi:hypothetical protein
MLDDNRRVALETFDGRTFEHYIPMYGYLPDVIRCGERTFILNRKAVGNVYPLPYKETAAWVIPEDQPTV